MPSKRKNVSGSCAKSGRKRKRMRRKKRPAQPTSVEESADELEDRMLRDIHDALTKSLAAMTLSPPEDHTELLAMSESAFALCV